MVNGNMRKRLNVFLNRSNNEILRRINSSCNVPFTDIVNMALEYFFNHLQTDNKLIENFKNYQNNNK